VVLKFGASPAPTAAYSAWLRSAALRPGQQRRGAPHTSKKARGIRPRGVPLSGPEIQDLSASIKKHHSFGELSTVGFHHDRPRRAPEEVRYRLVDGSISTVVASIPSRPSHSPQDDGPKKPECRHGFIVSASEHTFQSDPLRHREGRSVRSAAPENRSATIVGSIGTPRSLISGY